MFLPRVSLTLFAKCVLPVVFLLTGCTVGPAPKPDDPNYAPVVGASYIQQPPSYGAIYSGSNSGAARPLNLFSDKRAHRVGDIITVTLTESTTSSKKAETDISKDTELSIDESVVLGDTISLGDYSLGTSVNNERSFEGDSESAQSNSLRGSIAVTVAEVLPNGLLLVRGEKWMTLNRGEEFIRVRGLIRPEDVAPDNTIPSNRLADARITYSGTGAFAESNEAGWLSKFFVSRWWPF